MENPKKRVARLFVVLLKLMVIKKALNEGFFFKGSVVALCADKV
jgi:hypothetical protein